MSRSGTTAVAGGHLAWQLDDYTDPWLEPATVVLLHGIAESGEVFRAWVPHLARHLRVLRPDLRGFGESSSVQEGQALQMDMLVDDIAHLVDSLALTRVHLVGAKLGAQIAIRLATRRPSWLKSMSLAGVLISPSRALGRWVDEWIDLIETDGVAGWARATMPGRMGSSLAPAAMDWWSRYMGLAPASAVKACIRMLPSLGEPEGLDQISCPTQIFVAVQPGDTAQFDQRQPLEAVLPWQQRIPDSRLAPIEADSYHLAGSHPDACARAVCAFITTVS